MIDHIAKLQQLGISSSLAQFKDNALENEFAIFRQPNAKFEVRIGAIAACLCWSLFAVLEPINTPSSSWLSVYVTAFIGISALVGVYFATHSPVFSRYHQLIASVGVVSTMLSICYKINFYPDFPLSHYFPAFMLITMWMFSISGLSFISGILCGLIFYTSTNLSLLMSETVSSVDYVTYTYYMITSYFIGAAINYHKEVQARKIFLAHQALEEEKQHHQHKSIHDPLTKLPNRELLEDRLHQAISFSTRNQTKCAGLFIDLDKFKTINDQYSHLVGDLYLKEVARCLQDITREADTVARIGGDEFFLLMLNVQDEESALALSRKIQDNLSKYFILADKIKLKGLGASVGVCMLPYEHCTPNDIINRADKAMYQMKYLGKTLAAA